MQRAQAAANVECLTAVQLCCRAAAGAAELRRTAALGRNGPAKLQPATLGKSNCSVEQRARGTRARQAADPPWSGCSRAARLGPTSQVAHEAGSSSCQHHLQRHHSARLLHTTT